MSRVKSQRSQTHVPAFTSFQLAWGRLASLHGRFERTVDVAVWTALETVPAYASPQVCGWHFVHFCEFFLKASNKY